MTEIETLKKENEHLSKQPSVKPVSTRMSKSENKFDNVLNILNGTAFKN